MGIRESIWKAFQDLKIEIESQQSILIDCQLGRSWEILTKLTDKWVWYLDMGMNETGNGTNPQFRTYTCTVYLMCPYNELLWDPNLIDPSLSPVFRIEPMLPIFDKLEEQADWIDTNWSSLIKSYLTVGDIMVKQYIITNRREIHNFGPSGHIVLALDLEFKYTAGPNSCFPKFK